MTDDKIDSRVDGFKALRERLAAIEHERWAHWQRWMHDVAKRDIVGNLILPADRVLGWERQIATPYAQLTENEKDSDRRQVDRYWPLVKEAIEAGARAERERWEALTAELRGLLDIDDPEFPVGTISFRVGMAGMAVGGFPALAAALREPEEENDAG